MIEICMQMWILESCLLVVYVELKTLTFNTLHISGASLAYVATLRRPLIYFGKYPDTLLLWVA
jgi:hypothetical protein